jgi:hypothetical protein
LAAAAIFVAGGFSSYFLLAPAAQGSSVAQEALPEATPVVAVPEESESRPAGALEPASEPEEVAPSEEEVPEVDETAAEVVKPPRARRPKPAKKSSEEGPYRPSGI